MLFIYRVHRENLKCQIFGIHLISAANFCVAGGKLTIGFIDGVGEMELARRARAVDAMPVGTREDLDIEDVASRRTDQAE